MLIATLWNIENKNLSSNDHNPKLLSCAGYLFYWQLSFSICFPLSTVLSLFLPSRELEPFLHKNTKVHSELHTNSLPLSCDALRYPSVNVPGTLCDIQRSDFTFCLKCHINSNLRWHPFTVFSLQGRACLTLCIITRRPLVSQMTNYKKFLYLSN